MAISIKTNLTSLMARRNLSKSNQALKTNIERLSTGQRINSAADDAAGLSVSESMKADIRSMEQASRNANDAVSMLETAEGALNQTHDILGRMKELSVQANTDSIGTSERADLNQEFEQLKEEMNDIAEETNFNDVTLLDGSFTGKSLQVGPKASNTLSLNISQRFHASQTSGLGLEGDFNASQISGAGDRTVTFATSQLAQEFASGKEFYLSNPSGTTTTATVQKISGATVSFDTAIGLNSANSMFAEAGLDGNTISTKNQASITAKAVNDAIARVSTERAKLGAQINRLDTKLENLSINKQSMEAANSRIRDVDVAKEMADLTKNQILTQAGTSMLSQANSMPETALSLLGGG